MLKNSDYAEALNDCFPTLLVNFSSFHISQPSDDYIISPESVIVERELLSINPLRPNNDVSQTSHCNIKSVSVSEVMRIENMITQVHCY